MEAEISNPFSDGKDVYDKLKELADKVDKIPDLVGHVQTTVDGLRGELVMVKQELDRIARAPSQLESAVAGYGPVARTVVEDLAKTFSPARIGRMLSGEALNAAAQQLEQLAALPPARFLGGIDHLAFAGLGDLCKQALWSSKVTAAAFRAQCVQTIGALCDALPPVAAAVGFTLPFDPAAWKTTSTALLAALPDPFLAALGGQLAAVDLTAPAKTAAKLNAQVTAPRAVRRDAAAAGGDEPSSGVTFATDLLIYAQQFIALTLWLLGAVLEAFPFAFSTGPDGSVAGAVGGVGEVGAAGVAEAGATAAAEAKAGWSLHMEVVSATGCVALVIGLPLNILAAIINVILAIGIRDQIGNITIPKPPSPLSS